MSVSCSPSVTHGGVVSPRPRWRTPLSSKPDVTVAGLFLPSRAWATTRLEDPQGAPHDTPFSKVHSSGDKGIMHAIIFFILIVQSSIFKIRIVSQAVGGPQSSDISCVPSK